MQTKVFFSTALRRSLATLALPLMLVLPLAANAAFIDFTGSVTGGGTGAVPAPFNIGDPLDGTIGIDDAAAAPGSMFDVTDLLAFDFTVGSVDFSLPAVQPFRAFSGTVADDGMSLSDFRIITNLFGSIPGCGNCSLNLSSVALNSTAPNSFTVQVLSPGFGIAEGTLNQSIRGAANVPEPSEILMLALGLMLLGIGLRRRALR